MASKLDVEPTDYGYRYFATKELPGEGRNYVRGYHWVMPHVQIRASMLKPDGSWLKFKISGHHWVPIDDETTMVLDWFYSLDEPLTEAEQQERGARNGPTEIDQKTFRSRRNRANDGLIDRELQRTEYFAGVHGISAADRMVQEAMEPVVDRSKEHLGQTDRAIIVARKQLLRALQTVQDGGTPPGTGTSYYNIRAMEEILLDDVMGRDALLERMYAAM